MKYVNSNNIDDLLKLIYIMDVVSLNVKVKKDGDINENSLELCDLIEDKSPSPQEIVEEKEKCEVLLKTVKSLKPRECKVICLRYGLEDGVYRTLDEVGQIYGVTRERIRQIEAKALKKLRFKLTTGKFKNYF